MIADNMRGDRVRTVDVESELVGVVGICVAVRLLIALVASGNIVR